MNVLAVALGALFFPTAAALASRAFGAKPLIAMGVFLSCPAIMITYTYGNEAALALFFLLLAVGVATLSRGSVVLATFAGALTACAALSRLDYVVFIAIIPLFQLVSTSAPRFRLDRTSLTCAAFTLATSVAMFAMFYYLILGSVPSGGSFDHTFSFKQTAAYLTYGLSVFLVPAAAVGCVIQFRRNWLQGLLLLLVAAHAAAYAGMFTSPKYVLPLFLIGCIFAAIGLSAVWQHCRFCAVAMIALPWFVSVTPFGVKTGLPGALYFVPTDDGPLPSGAFAAFYSLANQGFFQQRYIDEERQISRASELMVNLENPVIVGFFNQQTSMLVGARRGDFNFAASFWPNADEPPKAAERPIVMIKTSYLYPRRMSPAVRTWFRDALKNKHVTAMTHDDDPFPDAILITRQVHNNTEAPLATRISELLALGGDEQWLERARMTPELESTAWIRRGDGWTRSSGYDAGAKFYSLKSPKEILALNPN